ncbi:MAG: DUF2784 domain-containing protein [Gemmatimonadales bacterium]|jgi:hypothetical protein
MLPRLAADFVVILHLAFVAFVVGGGFLAWRWRKIVWFHVPAAVWGALIEFAGWICPLTPLENVLRRQAGQAGYEGGFVEHYLMPVLYPSGLTTSLRVGLGIFVIAVNAAAYWGYLRRRRRPQEESSSR